LRAGNIEELRKETLSILQTLCQADKSTFFLPMGESARAGLNLDSVSSHGITDKSMRLFRQYYHQLDPFKMALKKLTPPPQVVTFDELVPSAKLVKTEYYNDFLKPQNIHDQLSIYFMSGNQFLGVTSLFRPRNSPVFSFADRAKAKLIAPIVTAALERAISLKKNRELEQAIRSIAIELPYQGLVVLNPSLTPVYFNEVAAGIIERLHRLSGQHRSFPPDLPDSLHAPIQEMAASIKHSKPNVLPRMDLNLSTPNSAKKVTASIRALIDDTGTPLILICFNPMNHTVTTDSSLKQHGISPRELDIIQLLAEGKKNSEIAEILFISEYTVENHLRSIYRKMDVKNRTTLVHKLIKIRN
jgi:DNA-binding CsgD family transcriptional regulator